MERDTILSDIKQDDLMAFKRLFDSYYLSLYTYARRFIKNPEDVKDILQNIFLNFWSRRKTIEIHTSLQAYFYRSVQNECLNFLRDTDITNWRIAERIEDVEVEDKYNSPDEVLSMNEVEKVIEQAIRNLPDQCREIFIMSRLKGMKNKEIAATLDISIRTVENQVYRALKVVRVSLGDYLAICIGISMII